MYLSHPVRRMRDDPNERTVSLVVELGADAGTDRLRDVVADAGGDVDRDLGFDCWQVSVSEQAIGALCDLEEIVRVETAATLERGVDDDSTKPDS